MWKIQFFHILKFCIWWPWHWPSPSNKFIHFSIVFVYLYVVLNACNTCYLISFHLPIQILLQNMWKYEILKNHEMELLWPWPWPKIKNFSIQFFIVSNRRHIACYIHISGFLVHRCKNYTKQLQNMSKSHFFRILKIVKICIF